MAAVLDVLQGAENFAQQSILPLAIAVGGTVLLRTSLTRTIGENEVGIRTINKRARSKYPPYELNKAWRAGRHGRIPLWSDIVTKSVADEKEAFESITLHRSDGVQYTILHNMAIFGVKCPSVTNANQFTDPDPDAGPEPVQLTKNGRRTTRLPEKDAERVYRALFKTDNQPLGQLVVGKCIQSLGQIMPDLPVEDFNNNELIFGRVAADINQELDERWGLELRDLILGTYAVTGAQLGKEAILTLAPHNTGIVSANGNVGTILAASRQVTPDLFNT